MKAHYKPTPQSTTMDKMLAGSLFTLDIGTASGNTIFMKRGCSFRQ
jgi:hypothetical protein